MKDMKEKPIKVLNISIDFIIKDEENYCISNKEVFRKVLMRKIKMMFPKLKFNIYLQTKEK